jgi:hypothetical protein
VVYVGVLQALVWLTQGVHFLSDTPGYLAGITAFGRGEVTYFPPGYSLFLAPWVSLWPSAAGLAITAVQHVWMVAALFFLQRMIAPVLGSAAATVGLLVAGSAAPVLFFPQSVLSETVGFCTTAVALWSASRHGRALRWRDGVSGIFVGWATLTRVVPLAAVALPLAFLHIDQHGITRRALLRTFRVMFLSGAVVVAVMIWFHRGSDTFALTTSADLHLYNRVISEQSLVAIHEPATRLIVERLGGPPQRGVAHWDVMPVLQSRGLSWTDARNLLGDVAREGIRGHVVEYLWYTPLLAWREYAAGGRARPPLWSGNSGSEPSLENEPPLSSSSSAAWRHEVEAGFERVWPLLMWAPLAGVIGLRRWPHRLIYLALLLVAAGYLFASSLVEYFNERFIACVFPFVLVLTPAPFVMVWHRLTQDGPNAFVNEPLTGSNVVPLPDGVGRVPWRFFSGRVLHSSVHGSRDCVCPSAGTCTDSDLGGS